ncbi:MAG: chaperone NapD [Kangiellaceae bacterium]|nr:chaperone NapD [Kangiellaceae bacterium]MCW9000110.1 chaperone NapD [Kangiellaceae bacterium]
MTKPNTEYHVTSLVCQVWPKHAESIQSQIESIENVEVHANDDHGKFLITIEGRSQKFLELKTEAIKTIDGVLTIAPVYHEYLIE